MFSLVITIISIALVSALVLATLYFGGNAFNKGSEKADASKLINIGQQIAAAFTLRDVDASSGVAVPSLTAQGLPDSNYLTSTPIGWSALCSGGLCQVKTELGLSAIETCKAVNVRAGLGATLELTVFAMATSLFHCSAVLDEAGQATGYVFNFLYKKP